MKKQETTLETQLYHWGWIVLITVAALIAGKRIFFPDFSISGQMPPCVFHRLTGYFCPALQRLQKKSCRTGSYRIVAGHRRCSHQCSDHNRKFYLCQSSVWWL